jgi:hypothetical protein
VGREHDESRTVDGVQGSGDPRRVVCIDAIQIFPDNGPGERLLVPSIICPGSCCSPEYRHGLAPFSVSAIIGLTDGGMRATPGNLVGRYCCAADSSLSTCKCVHMAVGGWRVRRTGGSVAMDA